MMALRTRYVEGQTLTRDVLVLEQCYRLSHRRLHDRNLHFWGILNGLDIIEENGATLSEGMAVDRLGRMIVLSKQRSLFRPRDVSRLNEVWIAFAEEPCSPPRRGRYACGPRQHARWHEIPEIDDFSGSPDQTGLAALPLGQLGDSLPHPPVPPLVMAPGEAIHGPSKKTILLLGPERPEYRDQFAILLAADDGAFQPAWSMSHKGRWRFHHGLVVAPIAEKSQPRLVLPVAVIPAETPDQNSICGDRDRVMPKKPSSRQISFGKPVASTGPRSWQIYRTAVKRDDKVYDQFRIELAHPGKQGLAGTRQLVLASDENPIFRIHADHKIVVTQRIKVTGEVVRRPIPADPANPEFGEALTSAWLEGAFAWLSTASFGQVLTADDQPVLGATVSVEILDTGEVKPSVTTGPTGHFFFSNVSRAGATINIKISAAGFEEKTFPRKVGQKSNLKFGLKSL